MLARARRIQVPQAYATAQSSRNGSNSAYASAFALPLAALAPATAPRSAEQWARAVFEGAPPILRSCILFGWRVVLGLRLQPLHAPDRVLGWRMVGETPDHDSLSLEADSRLLRAENLVAVDDHVVLWVTVVHFESRFGRLLWGAASVVHHRTIPYLLDRAARTG